eukprot:6486014-Amphidinium_carterae.5
MLVNIKHAQELANKLQSDCGSTLSILDDTMVGLHNALPLACVLSKAKLLQLRTGFAMLEFAHCGMSKITADCLLHCLNGLDVVSKHVEKFNLKCRSVCLDKGPSNASAERHMMNNRSQSWKALSLPCDVHIMATCFKKCFDGLFPEEVSGLIKTSLSVREGGKFFFFRAALAAEVRSRKLIFVAPLSPAAAQHKHELEYVVGPGSAIPEERVIKERMVAVLLIVLAGSQLAIFPRSRWTAPEDIDDGVIIADN